MAKKTETAKKTGTKKVSDKAKTSAKKKTTDKTIAPKKTAATKKAAIEKKMVYKQSAKEKKLVKELTSLALQMDEEGLLFLIEQANVHLYNMEVIALQEEVVKLNRKKNDTISRSSKTVSNKFRIEKSEDGSVYHIIFGGKWKLINADELFRILKIVNAPVEPDEVRLNLLHWFFKERADFVGDFGLRDTHDERWLELIKMFKTNFKLKK